MAVSKSHPRSMTRDKHRVGRKIFRAAGKPAFGIERVSRGGKFVMLRGGKQLVLQEGEGIIHQGFIAVAREDGDFQPRFHVIDMVMETVAADVVDALARVRGGAGNIVNALVERYANGRHNNGGISVGEIHQRVGINSRQQGVEGCGVLLRIIAQQQLFQVMRVPVAVAGGATGEGKSFGSVPYFGQPGIQRGVLTTVEQIPMQVDRLQEALKMCLVDRIAIGDVEACPVQQHAADFVAGGGIQRIAIPLADDQ